MAAAAWKMIWTNYDTVPVGEIDSAADRKFVFRHNQPNTIEFNVPLSTLIGRRIAAAPYGFGLVKLYRNGTLEMVAETTSLQVVGKQGEKSVAVSAVETMYPRMAAYYPSAFPNAPFTFPLVAGQAGSKFLADKSAYLAQAGVTAGTAGTTASMNPSLFEAGTTLLDLLQAIALRTSGFDYWATPLEPWYDAAAGYKDAAQLEISALRGTTKPNIKFEFGTETRANVDDYTLTAMSGDHLANDLLVVGPTTSTSDMQSPTASSPTVAYFGPRLRYVTTDYENATLRKSIADLHQAKRQYPRLLLTMNPSPSNGDGRVPQFITDYDIGDIVPARIRERGTTLIDANVRVYGVAVSLDKTGMESIELTLNSDTAA